MATILLTGQTDTSYVRVHPIGTSDRLRARLHAWQLDRALARGAPPDSTVALSLRAHRLIGPGVRHAMARELRALPHQAARAQNRLAPGVPICRRQVLQAAGVLALLADRLADSEPVEALGVAQLRVLLRDASSPLFDPNRARELEPELHAALDALDCCVGT